MCPAHVFAKPFGDDTESEIVTLLQGPWRFALRLVMIWLSLRGLTASEIAALFEYDPRTGSPLARPLTTARAYPKGPVIAIVLDNVSTHSSRAVERRLADHARVRLRRRAKCPTTAQSSGSRAL